MASDLFFTSTSHTRDDAIPHERNNWICYDFKRSAIFPTHYAIRTNRMARGGNHLRSWIVETSVDRESWREIDHKEGNSRLNGPNFTQTFKVTGAKQCRFVRLVNIGRNHGGIENSRSRGRRFLGPSWCE
jgi:hypothetical protein